MRITKYICAYACPPPYTPNVVIMRVYVISFAYAIVLCASSCSLMLLLHVFMCVYAAVRIFTCVYTRDHVYLCVYLCVYISQAYFKLSLAFSSPTTRPFVDRVLSESVSFVTFSPGSETGGGLCVASLRAHDAHTRTTALIRTVLIITAAYTPT
jgi:hypothetical protein